MEAQTTILEGLNIVSGFNPALTIVCDSLVECGDVIRYTDDSGQVCYGIYQTLWVYEHDGETSPFWGDTRIMAYVLKLDGGSDYADVMTIEKLADAMPTMFI